MTTFKMKRVQIEDAEDGQIKDFVDAQGVDTDGATSRAALMALLSSVWEQSFIMVADVPEGIAAAIQRQVEEISAPAQQRLEGGLGDTDPFFKIKIAQTSLPGGKDPVPVSVNGRAVVIQRGLTAEVPARYYFALMQAVRAEVEQNLTTGEITEIEISNYPVTVLEMPSRAEIEEWHARVDEQYAPA